MSRVTNAKVGAVPKREPEPDDEGTDIIARCVVCTREEAVAATIYENDIENAGWHIINVGEREFVFCAGCHAEAPVFDSGRAGNEAGISASVQEIIAAIRAVEILRGINELLRQRDVRVFNARLTQAVLCWRSKWQGELVLCSNAFTFDLHTGEDVVSSNASAAYTMAARLVKEFGIDPQTQKPFEPLKDDVEAGVRGLFRRHGRINPDTQLDLVAKRFSRRTAERLYPFLKWAWEKKYNLAAAAQQYYLDFWRLPAERRARYERASPEERGGAKEPRAAGRKKSRGAEA